MADYGTLKGQIATDLRRSNLSAEIAQAVLDAIQCHSDERFYFNETSIYTLSTVAGTDDYDITPQDPIQEYIRIHKLRTLQSNTWYTLTRETPDDLEDLRSTPTNGQPFRWAIHGNELQLWPTPQAVYAIKVFGHY